MDVDIAGRVENLPLPITQPYIPVFECIVNSLESIDESGRSNGRVDVHFHRDDRQAQLVETGDDYLGAIRDVTVIDNGAGFSDINAKAFDRCLVRRRIALVERLVLDAEYRFMLSERYGDYLDRISPNVSDDQLDIELYKVQKDIEIAHREQARQIDSLPIDGKANAEVYKELRERFLREENELGQAALAKYVVHRRTILELLDRAFELQDDGRYAKEEAVHSIIFPMRATSDDVDYDRQNLWVIDERLAYHWYLGSDLPMSRLKAVNSSEGDEPDIVVFNSAKAFAESKRGFTSAVIVEFKRPERNEYPASLAGCGNTDVDESADETAETLL
jgi:hypothetical protein